MQGSDDHRDLHSFPTRRSSDLRGTASPGFALQDPGDAVNSLAVTSRSRSRNARSEEHTSELQSHVNLVCRLLLEKKNDNIRYLLTDAHAADQDYNHDQIKGTDP